MFRFGAESLTKRILLFGLPHLVRDVLAEAFSSLAEAELLEAPLAGEVPSPVEADALILWRSDNERFDYLGLLCRHRARFAVETDGRDVTTYELRLARSSLGSLSPSALVDVVRAALQTDSLASRPGHDHRAPS